MAAAPSYAGDASLEALARQHGLTPAGAPPSLPAYLRELWSRRYFIAAYSRASVESSFGRTLLGNAWQILTPLLNAAVYYFIFGIILAGRRGIENFAAYLVIGVFVFHFMTGVINTAARVISKNLNLIRTLHFPRAVLPVVTTVTAARRFAPAVVVMLAIVLVTGEPIRLQWLALVPAVALLTAFTLGLGLIVARLGARVPDTPQFLPFLLRTWTFSSGIFFSIDARVSNHTVNTLLHCQPGAVAIDLFRGLLVSSHSMYRYDWLLLGFWSLLALAAGLLYFWRGEGDYARG